MSAVVPKTPETIARVRQWFAQPLHEGELPDIDMDDTTARDLPTIWRSIEAAAAGWALHQQLILPGAPSDPKEFWGCFAKTRNQLLPVLAQFLRESTESGEGKLVIDLGSGNSPAAPILLAKGYRVIAVDTSRPALEMLRINNQEAFQEGRLQIVEEDIVSFVPTEPADLVIAADSLMYINPSHFRSTWEKIHNLCLKSRGTFIGSLVRLTSHYGNKLKHSEGAWLLWDRRMVRPLLTAGYEIKTCQFRDEGTDAFGQPREQRCIQFVAEKI